MVTAHLHHWSRYCLADSDPWRRASSLHRATCSSDSFLTIASTTKVSTSRRINHPTGLAHRSYIPIREVELGLLWPIVETTLDSRAKMTSWFEWYRHPLAPPQNGLHYSRCQNVDEEQFNPGNCRVYCSLWRSYVPLFIENSTCLVVVCCNSTRLINYHTQSNRKPTYIAIASRLDDQTWSFNCEI